MPVHPVFTRLLSALAVVGYRGVPAVIHDGSRTLSAAHSDSLDEATVFRAVKLGALRVVGVQHPSSAPISLFQGA